MAEPVDGQPKQTAASPAVEHRGTPAPATASPDDRQTIHAINQRIFDTSLDLILVVDRRGTFVRVSPSARKIIGYDPAELVGRSAREVL
jgi:PAS domain S-box-containing protein